jgi:hypothetical protein
MTKKVRWSLIACIVPKLLIGVSDRYPYRAVDPILPIPQLQFENDFSPVNSDTGKVSNILYFKTLWRALPSEILPFYQGIRIQFEMVTTPSTAYSHGTTNLGDTQFLDLFCATGDWWEFGLGPMAIFPTAIQSSRGTGQGKWQLGPALGVLLEIKDTQIGVLAQNPISFAGNSHRPNQNYLLFQPFFFQHLGHGWFFHANPQWSLDWLQGIYKIPLNFGGGRILRMKDYSLDIDLRLEGMVYENSPTFTPQFTIQLLFSFLLQ